MNLKSLVSLVCCTDVNGSVKSEFIAILKTLTQKSRGINE